MQMAVVLTAIWLTSFLRIGEMKLPLLLILSLVAAIGSDFLFLKLRGKPLFFPSAAIVSGIIIALLISPNSPWYQILLPGLLAMFSKNFLHVSERHIFNPAAFGLLVSGIILRQNISWWGVSWQQLSIHPLAFIILLTPFLVSALRMRRYFIQLAFLFVIVLFKASPLDPTLLFFAAVMLPEPMTTPSKPPTQLAFGTVVALLSLIPYSPDPLLVALLISNALFSVSREKNKLFPLLKSMMWRIRGPFGRFLTGVFGRTLQEFFVKVGRPELSQAGRLVRLKRLLVRRLYYFISPRPPPLFRDS